MCWRRTIVLVIIAVITWNSNLVPLIEGLGSSNPYKFEFSGFLRMCWRHTRWSRYCSVIITHKNDISYMNAHYHGSTCDVASENALYVKKTRFVTSNSVSLFPILVVLLDSKCIIDWFWSQVNWLISAHSVPGLCTHLSAVPQWGPIIPQKLKGVSTNSRFVRKIGSQNQSIPFQYKRFHLCAFLVMCIHIHIIYIKHVHILHMCKHVQGIYTIRVLTHISNFDPASSAGPPPC